MRKVLLITLLAIMLIAPVLAQEQTDVYYFWRPGCSHCANVDASGILEKVAELENVNLQKLNLYDQDGRDKFDYFAAGFGIFKAIQSLTAFTHYIYLLAGILVLILGLWQFKDILMPHIGPQLAISPRVKPFIENMIHKGTLPAIILLGIVVSLFELPCTGGIYLGILTMMSIQKTFAIGYLFLYNLIFILPLIILTFIIYKGTSPERLQKWTSGERTWMKLAAGIVLIILGVYILFF